MSKSQYTQLRLSPALKKALYNTAEAQRRSMSNVIRVAIERYVSPPCPACDSTTFLKDNVWYCPDCGLKVAFIDNGKE